MNSATHLAEHCRTCDGLGYVGRGLTPCSMCEGGRRLRGTHDAASAIDFDDGIDPAHVVAMREAIGRTVTVPVPVAEWLRIRELARLCRSPENSGPLAELLGRIEGARHG